MKDILTLVKQLNVFVDNRRLLRVRSKFGRMIKGKLAVFPVLLIKRSKLTDIFVEYFHTKMFHSGVYNVITELRKLVYIPHLFSVVKRVIRKCVVCRRFKARPIQINQSPYRENRINPPQIPYRHIYMDYFGPYQVKVDNVRTKIYILCITCTYTRAINLKLCIDLTVKEFLRAFQMHCFEFGVPTYVVTDSGSNFVAGASMIRDFLKDSETARYFEENSVSRIIFEQYYKGNSSLGSLVESCVKLSKRLIFSAIRNNVLGFRDFEFLIAQTVHLVNKRPIAFKESLRDLESEDFLKVVNPEALVRGHEMLSINLIPSLQADIDRADPDWSSERPTATARNASSNLQMVRQSLIDLYHGEFLHTLIEQAVDVKDRYKPVKH